VQMCAAGSSSSSSSSSSGVVWCDKVQGEVRCCGQQCSL
jgi:hypothetical protein